MENVSLTREGNQIITEVDWQIEKGEHWALIGLNGAGKTTLLNILNGYLWPTTGKVSVLGQPFGKTDLRELRKAIGWVSSALQERMKTSAIAEDIVMSGKFSSIGLYEETSEADRNQALEIMRKLDIPQLEGRKYHSVFPRGATAYFNWPCINGSTGVADFR